MFLDFLHRCLFLGKQGLLPARYDAVYFWIHSSRLSVILAVATWFSVLCIGLLDWVLNGRSAEFKVCLLLPPIVLLGFATYSRWVKNDYTLVNWPPDADKDKAAGIKVAGEEGDDDLPDTARVTTDVLGDPFRPKDFYGESSGTSNLILPEFHLIGDGFGGKTQIPVLPLKSALQRTHATRQSQATRSKGTIDIVKRNGIDTEENGDVNGGENESNASTSTEQAEHLAVVRPKYVRSNDRVQLGVWSRAGEAVSKMISGEGPACTDWRRAHRRNKLKIGPIEHDEGERDGSTEHDALPRERAFKTDVDEEQSEVYVDSISFRRAFLEGYLLPHEYRACYGFVACILLIVVMGLLLSREEPGWIGHLIWAGILVIMFTFLPAAKWFGTYEVDSGMKLSLWLAGMTLTTSCVLMFLLVLDGDAFQDHSLAVLNAFVSYPVFAYGIFSVFQVIDGPTPCKAINVDGHLHGNVYKPSQLFDAFCRTIGHFLTFKFVLAVVTPLWLMQSFFWSGLYLEFALAIVVAVAALAGRIVQDFKQRRYFVSRPFPVMEVMRFVTGATMVVCLVIALSGVQVVAFCLTAFFLVWAMCIAMSVATRLMEFEADTIVYFSPWVFPAFTYDARTGNLVDVTPIACQVFSGILVGIGWGVALAVFVEPVGLGVVLACAFFIALISAAAWCLSWTTNRLGIATQFLDSSSVVEAGDIVRPLFSARHAVFQVGCPRFFGQSNIQDYDSKTASTYNAVKRSETQNSAANLAVGLEEKNKRLKMILEEETQSYRRRYDALYSLEDAVLEAFVSGKGPFGPIGLYGLWFGILRFLATLRRTCCPCCIERGHVPLFAQYFPDGQRRDAYELSPPLNHPEIMLEILHEEHALQKAFQGELRRMMLFHILLLHSAEARLQREGVLFRKFLKHKHSELLSNRVAPPSTIFRKSSFASVDISMVTVWLSGLTIEERVRFQMLRRQYAEIQSDRDAVVMRADDARQYTAKVLEEDNKLRGKAKSKKQRKNFVKRRTERADAWTAQLSAQDQKAFAGLRTRWLKHDNAAVHPTNLKIRESFEKAVLLDGEEVEANARENLKNIESGARDCRPGSFGRRLQYTDPVFPPDNDSVGESQCRRQLASRWKVSLSVNPNIRLFDEEMNPETIRRGAFTDTWLLSALSMISGATVRDCAINEQIAQLFVSLIGVDGRPVFKSSTGAYAVKMMISGEWQVVIVDDFFPAIESTMANNANKGLAVGHSYGVRQLWVSLLEKAYAKFYGSYATLEMGFVHHALTTFTGAQSEEFLLAGAGRGFRKKSLWKNMVRNQRNDYIMGAGTAGGNLAEGQVQDIGLVFGATYTILEVLELDGEQLTKLRYPPGNCQEWRGDWGNHSHLWTRRRRRRLGFDNNGRDNAFWMSFNDFCEMFRSLYVCRWYDSRKWTRVEHSGSWEVREDLNTAAGFPSYQQEECELENNPQFTLDVEHPTDVKISLIQTDAEVQPAFCLVFKQDRTRGMPRYAPRRVFKLSQEVLIASSGPPVRARERNVYVTLETGVYVVMCAAFMAGVEGSFKVKVTANSPHVEFLKLWPPASPDELAKAFSDGKRAQKKKTAVKWSQIKRRGGRYARKAKAAKTLRRSSTMP